MARRVDRLFQIVQLLRGSRVVTAEAMAERLGVSVRTVYRDIDHLSVSGIPIAGERGVGYRLLRGFELAPLMFDEEELRALVFGARMAAAWGDASLASAAQRALERIDAQLSESHRAIMDDVALHAPAVFVPDAQRAHIATLRLAIEARVKVSLRYQDALDARSERVVRPLGLFFLRGVWLLGAWCELREDFRKFTLARILSATALDLPCEPDTPPLSDFVALQLKPREPDAGAV